MSTMLIKSNKVGNIGVGFRYGRFTTPGSYKTYISAFVVKTKNGFLDSEAIQRDVIDKDFRLEFDDNEGVIDILEPQRIETDEGIEIKTRILDNVKHYKEDSYSGVFTANPKIRAMIYERIITTINEYREDYGDYELKYNHLLAKIVDLSTNQIIDTFDEVSSKVFMDILDDLDDLKELWLKGYNRFSKVDQIALYIIETEMRNQIETIHEELLHA